MSFKEYEIEAKTLIEKHMEEMKALEKKYEKYITPGVIDIPPLMAEQKKVMIKFDNDLDALRKKHKVFPYTKKD